MSEGLAPVKRKSPLSWLRGSALRQHEGFPWKTGKGGWGGNGGRSGDKSLALRAPAAGGRGRELSQDREEGFAQE
jgi:hypothetical protein